MKYEKDSCIVVSIDPGNTESALVVWCPKSRRILAKHYAPNAEILGHIRAAMSTDGVPLDPVKYPRLVAIEQVRSYGMAVGAEVFDTVHWSGRFHQFILDHWHQEDIVILVPRRDVKMTLCHTNKAKDANIRTAIVDMFGGEKQAKGCKKEPGPLYGISGDLWAALALAITVGNNLWQGKYEYNSEGRML